MTPFQTWLINHYYSQQSAKNITRRIKYFQSWLTDQQLNIQSMNYQKLLDYIGTLQAQKKSKSEINKTLRAIELYYDYLNDTNNKKDIPNIALNVRLRGVPINPTLLLTEEELLEIHDNFKDPSVHSYLKYTNKIILGLIIFQALDQQALFFLHLKDINLEKGTIYIRSGARKKNSRILPLKAHQIIPLQNYINHYRGIGKNFQIVKESSDKLFHPNCNVSSRLQDQLKLMAIAIKTDFSNIHFKRLTQLKQSRIGIWIEKYGFRKTQYMAGHKDIGSIQKYRGMDMKNLSKQIEMFHPLN